MTAVLLPRNTREFDRRLLRISLVVAVALHFGALMLPLPAAPEVVAPATPEGPIISLGDLRLPLPPPPMEPRPRAAGPARRIPVPMIEVVDLEPVDAPSPPAEVRPVDAQVQDWGMLAPVTPPPPAGPVGEDQPGLSPPTIIGPRTSPVYPEMGRKYRIEGVVVLRAVIGVEGEVTSVEVLRAPDPDLGFGDAAVRAVSTWRYTPGIYRGRPVPVFVTVYVDFELH